MTKIILSGASGAMGKVITSLINDSENSDFEIVAGYADHKEEADGFTIYDSLDDIKEEADVLVDFSLAETLDDILNYALRTKTNLVLATTGYNEKDIEKIKKASSSIAIVQSGNYSIGINIMLKIAKRMAELLEDFDIEIVEAHHNNKKDAPSGTANMIFDAVNEGRDKKLYKNQERFDKKASRDKNEVGMSSIRAGTISGDHTVIFAGNDEYLSLSHHAASKKIFAQGALKAANFIKNIEQGYYTVDDILDTKENGW